MSKMKSSPPPKKPASGSNRKGSGIGCSILAGVFLVGLVAAVIAVGLGLANLLANGQAAVELSGLTDETSPEDMIAQREQAEARLNSYGWVDKEAGVVRIPIDQAMALVAEKGLPVGSEETEKPTPEEILATATPAPESESEALPTETPVAENGLIPQGDVPAATPLPASPETPEEGRASEAPDPGTPAVEDSLTATPAPIPQGDVPADASEPLSEVTPTLELSPTVSFTPTVDLANVSFKEHVLPILEQHCVQCHGGEKPEGGQRVEEGLILKTYDDIMAGSWNGSVIEPGDVAGSYLIEQIVTGRMPKEGEDLSPAEIEIITAWVEAGAPDN